MFASVFPPARETLTSAPPGTRYVASRIELAFGASSQVAGFFQASEGGSSSTAGAEPRGDIPAPIGGWFGGNTPPLSDGSPSTPPERDGTTEIGSTAASDRWSSPYNPKPIAARIPAITRNDAKRV